jgi:hypothetical protein
VKIFEKHAPSANVTAALASQPLLRGGIKDTLNEALPSLPKSSPLRESFQNLFTAFSKTNKTFGAFLSVPRFRHVGFDFYLRIEVKSGNKGIIK